MTTSDRDDPGLRNLRADGQQEKHIVMPDAERLLAGQIRPVRRSYVHERCGAVTTMGQAIAETYSVDPTFYGSTFCAACRDYFPVGAAGEFVWAVPREGTPLGHADKVGT